MIDERIFYYVMGIFWVYLVVYFTFLKKPEEILFPFLEEEGFPPNIYARVFYTWIIFFSITAFAVFYEQKQLPDIANVSYEIVEGTVKKIDKRDYSPGHYTIWKTTNHRVTLKRNDGEEIYIRSTRTPDLKIGMEVKVRVYPAKSMVPVVTHINGKKTEIYQKERGVTQKEKMFVFAIYLFWGFLFIKSLNRQYATIGNQQGGKKWYYGGVASVLLWIIVAAVGIKGEYDTLLMGDLLVVANAIIYVCIFRLTWLVHLQDSERLVEILKGHYKCNTTIELERIPETEVQGYCTYKREIIREELSFLWIEESVVILLAGLIYILWNNKWKWFVITVLGILAVVILYIELRRFKKDSAAVRKAITSGLEYAKVKFDLRELRKLKKYRGTDGEIIWAKMRFDDDGELEDGDMAIAIRAVGTNVVFMEQEKKLSDILKEHYKYRRTIELERMSGIETERYCVYKKKKLRKKFIEFLILEASMIWVVAVVYILWESRLKWIAITAMIVGIVVALYMKERTFRRNFSALKKAPKFGLECAKVKITYRELRKYQGTDGEIIGAEMRLDDDGELEDGDMAIAVRAVGTDVVFIEPDVVMQGIKGEML